MALEATMRPEVSFYWQPGCSACLRAKEYLEGIGLPYESLNVLERADALAELTAAGLRSLPAVRQGGRFMYALNLKEVAAFLNEERNAERLPVDEILDRWIPILEAVRRIADKLPEEVLASRAIPRRDRSVRALTIHVFQIVNAFVQQLDDGLVDIVSVHAFVDPSIADGRKLLAFADKTIATLEKRIAPERRGLMPGSLLTHYGEQEFAQVAERAVFHCAQHARQLDVIAAGRVGAEIEVLPELYVGLPVPTRLWE